MSVLAFLVTMAFVCALTAVNSTQTDGANEQKRASLKKELSLSNRALTQLLEKIETLGSPSALLHADFVHFAETWWRGGVHSACAHVEESQHVQLLEREVRVDVEDLCACEEGGVANTDAREAE